MQYLETIPRETLKKLSIIQDALDEIRVYEKMLNQFGITISIDETKCDLQKDVKYQSKYSAKIDLMIEDAKI